MRAILNWFIANPVAANLLMLLTILGGFSAVGHLNNEFFPHIEPGIVQISVPYPGAGPLEVEEQICIKIEEAIADIQGIKEIQSTAIQGLGQVRVEMLDDWDLQKLINDIKTRVDAISTFPVDAERPIVADLSLGREVIRIVLFGGDSEVAIKELTLNLKDRLSLIKGVSQVSVGGVRDYQVAVEVPEHTLRAYKLSFADIAAAIRASSLNLPAGQMRNSNGDIQIQFYGQDYRARDFENIIVIKELDGSQVTLGQIATLRDTFEEKNFLVEYEGKIASQLTVLVGENPDTIGTATKVRDFLGRYAKELPPGFETTVLEDRSFYLRDRLDILMKNSIQGLVLVYVLLLLFLRPILASWVCVGIAVAYLGTMMVMSMLGISISVISTFAFLLILGLVVDDAIVVSENIYAHHERNISGPLAASLGVYSIAKPVILAVITTVMVFIPMLSLPGHFSDFMLPIPLVAIIALSFSLIEALLILPSHLSHLKAEREATNRFSKALVQLRQLFTRGLNQFSFSIYQPLLERSLRHRGITICFFLATLLVMVSTFAGGWLATHFMPFFEHERMVAQVRLREGVGFDSALMLKGQVEAGLDRLRRREEARGYDNEPVVLDSFTSVDGNTVTVEVNLTSNDAREITTSQLQQLWLAEIGEVHGVESFSIAAGPFGMQRDITLRLQGPEIEELRAAADDLKEILGSYHGVIGVNDSLATESQEIRISLKPYGESLGLNLAMMAQQVRHGFYGAEAQRVPQLREDVRVMVRYPLEERSNIEDLVNMRIKLDDGTLVPFSEIAEASFIPGYSRINRSNRHRVVDVFGDVVPGQANAVEITQSILKNDLSKLLSKYPKVTLSLEGDQQEAGLLAGRMITGLMFSLFAIYALVAMEFRSYLQSVYVLSAVPFGIAGAIIGHLLLGLDFSIPSGFGVMATAGVVVNSNLVLIDRINGLRAKGLAIVEAVKQGARERLRPILLTSITTFFGLIPILLEESPSAAPLRPLVVSLSFGVVFATTVTLLMVPALYTALESMKERLGFAKNATVSIDEAVEV